MQKPTLDQILAVYDTKGYKFFTTDKPYNLNIIGIRNHNTRSNSFDDLIGVVYSDKKGATHIQFWPATTDPGEDNIVEPINEKGAAVLVPGQHLGCWELGMHKGQYEALVQCEKLHVYRDNNRNVLIDPDKTNFDFGLFGINIHRANAKRPSLWVGEWSAGCQVFQDPSHYSAFMDLVRKSANRYGKIFSYTLLLEHEVWA